MSLNIYDASKNFKTGSYLDGMWSGPPGTDPRQRGVAPFTAVALAKDTSQQPLGMSQPQYTTNPPQVDKELGPQGAQFALGHQYNPNPDEMVGMPQIARKQNFMSDIERLTKAAVEPTTLPPQIGQQQFGGFGARGGAGSGLGSLGGNGQTNVSLNLQGSATMNGGNQNRGYPGMNSGSGMMGGGASGGAMGYAEGGSINASPRGLASFGRGGDTELIHMTKGEVRGLQQLALAHGGSLTINPHTGLPEAGFLKSLLPTLLGAALTATGIGAPMAAMMVGGGYGLAKGSLKEGLLAGLGAWSGSNLGESLASMGAATAPTTIGEAALPVTSTPPSGVDSISGAITTPLPTAPAILATPIDAASTATQTYPGMKLGDDLIRAQEIAGKGSFGNAQNFTSPNTVATTTPNAPILGSQKLGDMASGLGKVNPFSDTFNKTAATGFLDKNKYQLAGALASPVLDAMKPQGVGLGAYEPDEYDKRLAKYHISKDYKPYEAPTPNPYYRPQYAKGGGVPKYEGRDPRSASIPDVGIIKDTDPDTARLDAYAATLARLKKIAGRADLNYAAPTIASTPASPALKGLGDIGKPTAMMAAGGSLGGYSDGGHLLKGPGDGMSDNIPATINRKQPARLADGEFVVPADVVSHLGNGSTDAGAKKLYAMLNKVRQARTGRKAQGRQINSNKFMPV